MQERERQYMKRRVLAVALSLVMSMSCAQSICAAEISVLSEEFKIEEADADHEDKDSPQDIITLFSDENEYIDLSIDGSDESGIDTDTVSDSTEALNAEGEYYDVDGVVGGKIKFDKATGTVTSFYNAVTEAVIPDTIDGVKVVAIGDWATPQKDTFTKLVIPDSVTSVGQGLGQNSGITEIVIPSGISALEKYSFRGCNGLTEVVIPGNVKTIENCCFQNCTSLKSVTLESGVEQIGQNAFQDCSELVTLSMPSTLKKIDSYAFRYCDILEYVTYGGKDFYPFDGGVKGLTLEDYCFGGCFFGHPDFSASYKTGKWYKQLHQVKPTGDYLTDLMAIAESQMGYHEGNSLKDMSGNNTKGNGDYSEMVYWWNEPGEKWCGEYVGWCLAMSSMPYEMVHPKYNMMDAEGNRRDFEWADTRYAGGAKNYELKQGDVILFRYGSGGSGNHVILVDSVSQSGDVVTVESLNGNHSNDVSRDTYTINASTGKTINEWSSKDGYVDNIYSPDFSIAKGLKYYTVTFNMQGGEAAWNTKKLTNNASYGLMPLPTKSGYTFDGWYTEASGGTKITSYRRVRLTGNQTLYAHWTEGSGTPEEPEEPEEPDDEEYKNWKFDESTGTITSIPYDWTGGKIPSKIGGVEVKAIGKGACSNRMSVTSLIIPSSVTTIGDSAFSNCDNLKELTMSEGVKTLGKYVFQSCDNLESVIIPASVKSMGDYIFNNCSNLEKVTFSGNESKISYGRGTFGGTLFLRPDFSAPYKSSKYYTQLNEVSLTGDYVKDTISIAASQEGYHEGNSFAEMDGSNLSGNKDYAEMAYFTCSPSYKWWPYEESYSYGGWCGNYCNWCMAMASMPQEIHGWWEMDKDDYPTWSDTVYAGGDKAYKIKAGDVIHMNIGHYCIVTDVRQEGDRVIVGTWNGNNNNDVGFDYNEFRASDGYNLTMAEEYNKPGKNYDYGERYQVMYIMPYLPENISKVEFHNVTFDANEGDLPAEKRVKKLAENTYYGIMPIPVREGFKFDGWYTEKDGGKKITAYHKTGLTQDITLYAHWSETVKIDSTESGIDPNPLMEVSGSDINIWLIPNQSAQVGSGKWTVKDKTVATVTNAGKITGKKKGITSVTGTLQDGSVLTCNVTVAGVTLSDKTAKILVGESYGPLKLNFEGADSSHFNVSWTSTNPAVASVDEFGVINAVGKGSTVVTAWTGGKQYPCKVTVTDDAASLNPKKLSFGSSVTINPFKVYQPKYVTNTGAAFTAKGATWGYSEEEDADLEDENSIHEMTPVLDNKNNVTAYRNDVVQIEAKTGKISAVGMGTTTIWGVNTTQKSVTKLTITVKTTPARSTMYLLAGKTAALTFTGVKPADAEWEIVVDDSEDCEGCEADCIELEQKNGKYTGKVKAVAGKTGCAKVFCTYKGFTWETKVCVEDPALEASDGLTVVKGTNYTLTLNNGDSYETNFNGSIKQTPVWKNPKPAIAFADEYGVIHGRGKGSTVITTKIDGKVFKITVTVN